MERERSPAARYDITRANEVKRMSTMPLGKHTRTAKGTFRRERSDSTAGALREDYPEFSKVRADAKLGNIKKNLGLSANAPINEVRKALRERDK